ncbi:hypothetical protein [Acinetobacter sp. BSP-28]|uniref:hypothetical protein n=1 Tax=Acinetobacter sp. BSP-28 TaxID=3344661 RepID=UPI003770201F
MSFLHTLSLFAILCLLYGCTTSPTTSAQQRDAYLQQFIGQTSQSIQAKLNLTSIGYKQVLAPIANDQTLTYTVMRPITIPVPMAQNPADIDAGNIPIPVTPRAQSYDVSLQCKIIYRLENNIAKSVYYTGRTC